MEEEVGVRGDGLGTRIWDASVLGEDEEWGGVASGVVAIVGTYGRFDAGGW